MSMITLCCILLLLHIPSKSQSHIIWQSRLLPVKAQASLNQLVSKVPALPPAWLHTNCLSLQEGRGCCIFLHPELTIGKGEGTSCSIAPWHSCWKHNSDSGFPCSRCRSEPQDFSIDRSSQNSNFYLKSGTNPSRMVMYFPLTSFFFFGPTSLDHCSKADLSSYNSTPYFPFLLFSGLAVAQLIQLPFISFIFQGRLSYGRNCS